MALGVRVASSPGPRRPAIHVSLALATFAAACATPDTFEVPPQLLDPRLGRFGLSVVYVRPQGEPWVQRYALFFFPQPETAGAFAPGGSAVASVR